MNESQIARTTYLDPPFVSIRDAVQRAIAEDILPLGDVTASLIPPEMTARASFVARTNGVISGVGCARESFVQIDDSVAQEWFLRDGDKVTPGTVIAEVSGSLASIVTAERTALNFLGHLSGVATLTNEFVQAAKAKGGSARVWDTRKTTPGLRSLEKAAVRAGGGLNHRGNLSDWILLKDNHIAHMKIEAAVLLSRQRWPGRTVHVECDHFEQVVETVNAHADAILLDNMSVSEVTRCVAFVNDVCGVRDGSSSVDNALLGWRPLLEVSGGVTIETIAEYACTGVDQISIGAITNSAPVLDIGLDIFLT